MKKRIILEIGKTYITRCGHTARVLGTHPFMAGCVKVRVTNKYRKVVDADKTLFRRQRDGADKPKPYYLYYRDGGVFQNVDSRAEAVKEARRFDIIKEVK